MKKLWHGRFRENQDQLFDQINKSIELDARLYSYEIKASIAHAQSLAEIGIYNEEELKSVIEQLLIIEKEIASGSIQAEAMDEDVHLWIERLLTAKLGEIGKRIHSGRSRNDQVVTIVRLFIKDCYQMHLTQLKHLIQTLAELAEEHTETIMPGFTHLQAAQPISLAFYLLNYSCKLKRDYQKMLFFYHQCNHSPLGSGALAGVNYPLDRDKTAERLDFESCIDNALDAISDRDYVYDYLYSSSLIFNHLSQMAEDLIIWNTAQFNFINLADRFSSGSSIMPQKKNPDALELIRAKAAIVSSNLTAFLNLGRAIPYSYNKDLQEDKALIFSTCKELKLALKILPNILRSSSFNKVAMEKSVKKGFLNATDLADALVKKGIPFREAHQLVGKLVATANNKNISLEELSIDEFKQQHPIFDNWVYRVLDYNNCLHNKQSKGSTSPLSVKAQIASIKKWLTES